MTRIMASLSKGRDVTTVSLHAVRRLEMVLYVLAIRKKFITWEVTVQGDYRVYELGWYLVRKIVVYNLNGHN